MKRTNFLFLISIVLIFIGYSKVANAVMETACITTVASPENDCRSSAYMLSDGEIPAGCKKASGCTTVSGGTAVWCSGCNSGYYYNQNTRICNVLNNCATHDGSCGCKTCNSGYVVSNYNCVKDTSGSGSGSGTSTNTCGTKTTYSTQSTCNTNCSNGTCKTCTNSSGLTKYYCMETRIFEPIDGGSTSCSLPYIGIPGGTICSYTGLVNSMSGSSCCLCNQPTCCGIAFGTGCNSCEAGYCQGCSPGNKYISSSKTCEKCPAGTYAASGATYCSTCQKGTYSTGGASSCTPCPSGQTTDSTGATSASQCHDLVCKVSNCASCVSGSENSCQSCNSGYYKYEAGSSSSGTLWGCKSCSDITVTNGQCMYCTSSTCSSIKCNPGYISGSSGTFCQACPAGTKEVNGSCVDCPVGTYNSIPGNTTCGSCPGGYTTSGTGATSESACYKIGTYYCLPYYNTSTRDCATWNRNMPGCAVDWQEKTSGCVNYPSGGCLCDGGAKPGYYWPSGQATNPIACPEGHYCTGGYDAPKPCPKGQYAGIGQSTCSFCPKAHYADTEGSATCKACSTDQTTDSTGSTSSSQCHVCPSGTSLSGTECLSISCKKGYYYDSEFGGCVICPKGTYQFEEGATMCIDCPTGTYNDKTGATSRLDCIACPKGTASPLFQGQSPEACKACKAGYYSDKEGAASCEICPTGKYSSGEKSTSCSACPTGWTTLGAGATSSGECTEPTKTCNDGDYYEGGDCHACPAGTYAKSGDTSCTKCPKNTYSDADGAAECTPCPSGQFTNTIGSTSASACLITIDLCKPETQYYDATLGTCVDCAAPDNATCSACSQTDGCTIKCKKGYYWNPNSQKCEIFNCPTGTHPTDNFCCKIDG